MKKTKDFHSVTNYKEEFGCFFSLEGAEIRPLGTHIDFSLLPYLPCLNTL